MDETQWFEKYYVKFAYRFTDRKSVEKVVQPMPLKWLIVFFEIVEIYYGIGSVNTTVYVHLDYLDSCVLI